MPSSTYLITPLILTYNEAPNIARTLDQLRWAQQVLVVDSFSTDQTLEILRSFPNVSVVQHAFESFASQCNYGLESIQTDWVLSLDADYILTSAIIQELQALELSTSNFNGYAARFRYCVYGRPLRGTLYPPRTVLYRKSKAHYIDDGHAHRVQVVGAVGQFSSFIDHDDRKSLSRWLTSQDRYMVQEVQKLLSTPIEQLSRTDRIRCRKLFAPLLVAFYCLFCKALALDGWPGWYYTFQRVLAEMLLSIHLMEAENLKSSSARDNSIINSHERKS